MASVGIVGGLGPESTIDYYRRILQAWSRHDPTSAPAIVIDSLDVRRALDLVDRDRPRWWSTSPGRCCGWQAPAWTSQP